jgi:hypothetical protein
VKKIFDGKLEGRRGRGRPRVRWINDVEDDIRRSGVKRWRMKALDREEWTSTVKEAKAKLKGRYSRRRRRRRRHFIHFVHQITPDMSYLLFTWKSLKTDIPFVAQNAG